MNKEKIRKYLIRGLLGFLAINLVLILVGLFVPIGKAESKGDNLFPSDYSLLNFDKSRIYKPIDMDEYDSTRTEFDNEYKGHVIKWTDEKDIILELEDVKAGTYEIALDYKSLQTTITNISINITVNERDVYENLELQSCWADSSDERVYDIYRNEVNSKQETCNIWRNVYLYDQMYYGSTPMKFELSNGDNTIKISKNSGDVIIGDIYICYPSTFDNYEKPKENTAAAKEMITLEAEKPLFKSTPEIRATSEQNVSMTPYSTKYNMINNISGDTFNKSGYSITYAFNIETSGNYNISMKYYISQTNTNVYSKILLDNVIMNNEMNSYKFKGKSGFNNETLNVNGEKMEFYLEAGVHTITIQLDASLQSEIYVEMANIIDEISELYLEIIKLTGGNTDKNKTWNIKKYIPTAETRLQDWQSRLQNLLDLTNQISKSNSKKQNRLYQNIKNAYDKLSTLVKNPNSLPHKLSILSTGSSSIANMLSDSLHTSTFSPLSLDKIYIHGAKAKLPSAKTNFFLTYFATVQRIFKSGVDSSDKDVLEIWVNRSTYYVSLMQQYADSMYTPKTGIKIRFSLLPDESKITYANASGTNPDAAIGVSCNIPYEMGIRGALVDLRSLEGFNETIRDFAPGAITNMAECDKVYGLPETQDFNVTFYRKDIMEKLGIEVPNTYEELIEILPELQRFGMNYYMPMAGGSGLKGISITAPFIYQYGGDIYSNDYMTTAIDSREAIAAMNMMVELFSIYSLPLTAQNFYDSFRNATVPIGVAGFDAYLQLMTAAPEIAGKWDITLAPGVKQEDGTIDRTNTGSGKACVIFNKSHKQNEAWDFIKWWLSADVQASFANDIQSTYGETFLWNTANLKAFRQLAIDKDHIEVILEQLEHLYNVPYTPATYIIERGLSDAWNAAVFDQVPVRAAISDAVIEINKEIKRKMIEFNYMDSNGIVVKIYYVPSVEDIKEWMR